MYTFLNFHQTKKTSFHLPNLDSEMMSFAFHLYTCHEGRKIQRTLRENFYPIYVYVCFLLSRNNLILMRKFHIILYKNVIFYT